MRLTRLARDVYDVLAFTSPSGECQVIRQLEQLEQQERDLFYEVAAFLRRDLPTSGLPPKAAGSKAMVPSYKELPDGILELRLGRRPGPAYRLLAFRGRGRSFICTRAFTKRDETTPPSVIDEAVKIKVDYELLTEPTEGEPS